MFLTKDFIETEENLIFAVVAQGVEHGKVLCFLRYVQENTQLKKLATSEANHLLHHHHADYLHYSPVLNAHLHAVPIERISKHHQPKHHLQAILHSVQPDAIEQDLIALCQVLQAHGVDLTQCGITGSLLIGAQHASSDIDLVCYESAVFQQCRVIIQHDLPALTEQDWQQSYQRRDCELSFADYLWHEQRKFNKGLINGRKFDLSLINSCLPPTAYQKCGGVTLQCRVIDDSAAFNYPAEFHLDHPRIRSVVSFTATYTGQAIKGELIEVSGQMEQDSKGVNRIVVGSSREARGEYIKVIRC
jgi:predicted nucleotidyltransferase